MKWEALDFFRRPAVVFFFSFDVVFIALPYLDFGPRSDWSVPQGRSSFEAKATTASPEILQLCADLQQHLWIDWCGFLLAINGSLRLRLQVLEHLPCKPKSHRRKPPKWLCSSYYNDKTER